MASLLLAIIYLSFISLGLPDGLLGAGWPSMYTEFGVPVSAMGIISFLIAAGTVVSSLQSDRLTRRFGVGIVTFGSVALSAASIIGFSLSHSVTALCLLAIPYGLAAGSIDAALNNYVALHYESRHMSWLHCMWGVGASVGPVLMGLALTGGHGWNAGYTYVGIIQIALTAVLFFSLPLWKKDASAETDGGKGGHALTLKEIFAIRGVWPVMLLFFGYCALEQSAGQWTASFLALARGFTPEKAADLAAMFYIGITIGRGLCGFVTFRLDDAGMIRLGFLVMAAGVVLLMIPLQATAVIGMIVVGLGCAPVYPSLIHNTPKRFGADRSQAIIGVQMASAYVGTTLMPPLFGLLSRLTGIGALPVWLLLFLGMMVWMNQLLNKPA